MALTDLTRISTSGIATGSTIDSPILRKDVDFRGSQVGVTSSLFDSSDDALEFNDNVKLKLGNHGDIQIYNDGTKSVIENGGSSLGVNNNSLHIYSQNDILTNTTYSQYFHCGAANKNSTSPRQLGLIRNAGVKAYYNDNLKFETVETGVVVTGILTASSYSGPISNPSGISTFYDLRVTNNLTVEGTTTTLDTNLIGVDRVEVGANSNSVVGVAITQSGTADILRLYDGSTQVVTVDDTGKVGIGSAIPTGTLTIHGLNGGNPGIALRRDTGGGDIASITWGSNTSSFAKINYRDAAPHGLQFYSGGTASSNLSMIIRLNGNVGIGSDLPSQKLDVAGTVKATGADINGDLDVDGQTDLDDVSIVGVTTFSTSPIATNGTYYKGIINSGSQAKIVGGYISGSDTLRLGESMYLTTTGLGIGINSPASILDVRQENDGGQTKIMLWNTDNDNTTTQTAGLFMSPDSRAYAYAGVSVIKEIADMSSNAGRDVSLLLNVTQNNSQVEVLRIDSSGRVLIGNSSTNTQKIGDGTLQVFTSDRKHPAIRTNSGNSNGYTMLSDAYVADESQNNIGISYSSSKLVLSTSVKVSDTADNVYLSSQDTFAARPCAFTMNHQGVFQFLNTNTSATTTTDSAVTLYERLRITRDGEMLLGTGGSDRSIAAQRFNSGSGWSGTLQIEKQNPNNGNNNIPIVAITAWNGANEQYTGGISFNRSNNNTNGTHGAVNTNQQLGNIAFNGSDGTNFIQGAEIFAIPDQTFATNDGPASLVFATTPDGTSEDDPQARLRITSGGQVNIGSNLTQTTYVCEVSGAYNKDGMRIVSGAPNYQDPLVVSSSTGGERFRIKGNGNIGVGVVDPKSKLHLPVNEDVRVGGQYGGTAQVQNEITYSSGYTGVHWMFESNQSVSWCFDGVMIINGSGSSSYGSEIVKITIVYSREYGALDSGDTWRNGTSSYNVETLGHGQVGLNPSAGDLSVTEETNPDGASSTRSLLKLSWSASGQSVGVVSRLVGNFHWGTPSGNGSVEIQDKDGNIYWNSNP